MLFFSLDTIIKNFLCEMNLQPTIYGKYLFLFSGFFAYFVPCHPQTLTPNPLPYSLRFYLFPCPSITMSECYFSFSILLCEINLQATIYRKQLLKSTLNFNHISVCKIEFVYSKVAKFKRLAVFFLKVSDRKKQFSLSARTKDAPEFV